MPELPEVETIRRTLRDGTGDTPGILGWVLQRAEVFWPRTLAEPSLAEFCSRLPGQVIKDIGRRGKYLICYFASEALMIHLRMSGDLWVEAGDAPPAPYLRLAIWFENGRRLVFTDARKFGRVWLVEDTNKILGNLGPEPLAQDFTAGLLYERLKVVRRQLKPLLLDQTFLAGLGNIYVDEALHMAGLHPLTISNCLNAEQVARLWESIREVLSEGIRRNGASIDWVFRGGDFQNHFRVYHRTGEPCLVCGAPIERLVVGQRGTHFCPVCQVKLI